LFLVLTKIISYYLFHIIYTLHGGITNYNITDDHTPNDGAYSRVVL